MSCIGQHGLFYLSYFTDEDPMDQVWWLYGLWFCCYNNNTDKNKRDPSASLLEPPNRPIAKIAKMLCSKTKADHLHCEETDLQSAICDLSEKSWSFFFHKTICTFFHWRGGEFNIKLEKRKIWKYRVSWIGILVQCTEILISVM